jgi:hypothetical protein
MNDDDDIKNKGEAIELIASHSVFKICSCCGKEFATRELFLEYVTYHAAWEEVGVYLYNCKCKSTLSLEIYEGSILDAVNKRKKR